MMRSKYYTTLRIEQLDHRMTPDIDSVPMGGGNVQVYLSGGNLYIIGDDDDNTLALWNVSPNAIRVLGTGTTVNNTSSAEVFALGAIRSVFINLRDGDDTIVLGDQVDDTGDTDSQNLIVLGNLRIDLGGGNNTVSLENLYVGGMTNVRAVGGDDTLDIDTTASQPSYFRGNVSVTLGGGNNDVVGNIFGVGGSFSLTTANGNDEIELASATIARNLLIAANNGADDISISDTEVYGNLTRIATGLGNDVINLSSSDFKRLFILTDGGNDTVDIGVTLGGVTAVSLDITTWTGNDTVNITDSDFQIATSVSTGADNDTINVSGSNFLGGLTVDGEGGTDIFNGLDASFGNTGIITLNNIETIN
ncbi:MAG: hypothetical protein RMJ19_10265 [Gemmatales bacterium]|nr:hypothetical protein [Gemmatales bacterium]MDW8176044.1 hypothetical protein [Gemmatales bacterium]